MTKYLKRYATELFIMLCSLTAGLVEIHFINSRDMGFIIIIFGFLLSITTISIKKEIEDRLKNENDINHTIEQIAYEDWRYEADAELQSLHLELQGWANGIRKIDSAQTISYQVALIRKVNRSIDAIHIGTPLNSILLWESRHSSFLRLLDAYQSVDNGVMKRRIFYCIREDIIIDKQFNSDVAEVFSKQIRSVDEDGLGFQVRILWSDALAGSLSSAPPDLLLVDGREAFIFKSLSDVEAVTNATKIENYRRLFESLWEMSEPIDIRSFSGS